MAYGNVEKPRQISSGLSHISTGPIEFLFLFKIKSKESELNRQL
jgi:hypothetical protein